jgi:methylaspartate ammonia-lyase
MKYNDKRLRESQLHNFGKRGSLWNENVATDFICKDSKTQKVKISLDQIMNTGNKQDQISVLAMLEALMRKFDEECETRTNIVLFTDNAACYHGKVRTSFVVASAK